jgi:hypothetical protein
VDSSTSSRENSTTMEYLWLSSFSPSNLNIIEKLLSNESRHRFTSHRTFVSFEKIASFRVYAGQTSRQTWGTCQRVEFFCVSTINELAIIFWMRYPMFPRHLRLNVMWRSSILNDDHVIEGQRAWNGGKLWW